MFKKVPFKLNKQQIEWLKALESGDYKQIDGWLNRAVNKDRRYCCLGVACEIFLKPLNLIKEKYDSQNTNAYAYNGESSVLPDEGMVHLNLHSAAGEFMLDGVLTNAPVKLHTGETVKCVSLVELNDDGELTHKEIAKFIRNNRELVFKNPND